MKIIYIGSVLFSQQILEHLLKEKVCEIVGVITKRRSSFNADFCSLDEIATKHTLPFLYAEDHKEEEIIHWIKELNPDVIYCFGWSNILKSDILRIPRLGVIGYHPAELPKNRGRHPIIWALALGLDRTASTFFFMDEGADSGDIISQEIVNITIDDDAMSLYQKLLEKAKIQVIQITNDLTQGTYQRIKQNHELSNYWRKRSKLDGQIDWRMSATSIYNLIRALTKPYVGAHCVYKGNGIKIYKAKIVDSMNRKDTINIEPGKVLQVCDNKIITVKCGEGIIQLVEHEFIDLPKVGEYI